MFIIPAKYIFLCDKSFTILENYAFAFDEKIKDIGKLELLAKKYPNAKIIKTSENSLILPAFINPHTHLEYSANAYNLHFGDFMIWLNSVINSRENLSAAAKYELISQKLKFMQKTGTGTVGEISSFGVDLKACSEANLRVIFFNEILGLNQSKTRIEAFLKRFNESKALKNDLFIPAISLHSAYSTNLELSKFAINFAKSENLPLSVHFLESKHEKIWLEKARGKMRKWLKIFNENPSPAFTAEQFLQLFKGVKTLFTHCVWVDDFEIFDKNLHFLTHCAFSNRLLSKKKFALAKAIESGLCVNLGTDGLSSNISLSMLDELRANLLTHSDFKAKFTPFSKDEDLIALAKILLLMATRNGAKALNLNLGEIKVNKIADFAVFKVNECDKNQLPLQFILNAKFAEKLFINGKECEI